MRRRWSGGAFKGRRTAWVALVGTSAMLSGLVGPAMSASAQILPGPIGSDIQDVAPPTFTFARVGDPRPDRAGTAIELRGNYSCDSPLSLGVPQIYKAQMTMDVRQRVSRSTTTRNARGNIISTVEPGPGSQETASASGSIHSLGGLGFRQITCDNTTRRFDILALTEPGQPTFTIVDDTVTIVLHLTLCDLLGCITGTGVYSDTPMGEILSLPTF